MQDTNIPIMGIQKKCVAYPPSIRAMTIESTNKMAFKRPNPRPRRSFPTQFVSTTLPGGGVASQWASVPIKTRVPSGHPSVVGGIIDKMRQGNHPTRPAETKWTPPMDYKFIARYMKNPEPFIKKCEAWHEQNPPREEEALTTNSVINYEPIIELYSKWDKVPPLPELEKAWRLAGYTEERIQKAIARREKLEATSEERQAILDQIFIKFPSASKPVPKPKTKKAIKVVKKKMPSSNNE